MYRGLPIATMSHVVSKRSFQVCFSHALLCGILTLPCFQASAQTKSAPLNLRVSSEVAPTGSYVQFKVRAESPVQIGAGAFSIDLDPGVFGDIFDVTVFGATGDAQGYARVSGRHAEVHFSSPSGSIGQLAGLPVAVFSAAANAGATVAVTIDPRLGSWLDTAGRPFTVSVVQGE